MFQAVAVILILFNFFVAPIIFILLLIVPQKFNRRLGTDFSRKQWFKYSGITYLGLWILMFVAAGLSPRLPQSSSPSNQLTAAPEVAGTTQDLTATASAATDPWYTDKQLAQVAKVIDGDTIDVLIDSQKYSLRFIGMDTPETRAASLGSDCYGEEAYQKTKDLLDGKNVWLEKDVSETDRYNRLLRYVYLDDHTMINQLLVQDGFAKVATYPPDVKYQQLFQQAETEAKNKSIGLWAPNACLTPTPIPTPTPTPVPTPKPTLAPTPVPTVKPTAAPVIKTQTAPAPAPAVTQPAPAQTSGGSWTCSCSKTCGQMSSCEEAYYQLNTCGCSARDGDHDGIPCESLCR